MKYLRFTHQPLYHALDERERVDSGAFLTRCGQAIHGGYVALYIDTREPSWPCVRCEVAVGAELPLVTHNDAAKGRPL